MTASTEIQEIVIITGTTAACSSPAMQSRIRLLSKSAR
jgi:hypothetical protein